jgi:hypothetical protein
MKTGAVHAGLTQALTELAQLDAPSSAARLCARCRACDLCDSDCRSASRRLGRADTVSGPGSAADLLAAVSVAHVAVRAFNVQVRACVAPVPRQFLTTRQTFAVPGDLTTMLRFWLNEMGRVEDWFRLPTVRASFKPRPVLVPADPLSFAPPRRRAVC